MRHKTLPPFVNYKVYNTSKIVNSKTGRVLKQYVDPLGYKRITLSHNGNRKTFYVHVLIGILFLKNPYNLPEVNHKDGNKQNNYHNNLEYVTHSDNVLHTYRVLGRQPSWQIATRRTPIDQILNGKVIKTWDSLAEAQANGFKAPLIHHCLNTPHHTHRGFHWKRH